MSNPYFEPKATLKEVAEKAGVSRSAASFVLNGRDQELRIASDTRDRILRAARELSYTPNHFARGLKGKSSRTIGILWSFAGPHRADGVIRHFSRRALASDYITNLFDSLSDPHVILKILRELANRHVDGIILQLNGIDLLNHPGIRKALNGFKASVVIGQNLGPVWKDQVDKNRDKALTEALAHLVGRGRGRLAYLGGGVNRKGSKIAALLNAWQNLGKSTVDFTLLSPREDETLNLGEAVRQAIDSVDWQSELRPDMLLCSSDEFAFISISRLNELGIRVPDDVAVVGANDTEMASYFTPALASIQRHDEQVADIAMEFLFKRIKNPEISPQWAEVDMTFVCRSSAQ